MTAHIPDAVVLVALGVVLAVPSLYLDWRNNREKKRLTARDEAARLWREQRRAELAASLEAQEARARDRVTLGPEEEEAFDEIARFVEPGIASAERIKGESDG